MEPEKPFPCKSTPTCIPMSYVCDDNYDCEDGYDEDREVCTAGRFTQCEPCRAKTTVHSVSLKLFTLRQLVKACLAKTVHGKLFTAHEPFLAKTVHST